MGEGTFECFSQAGGAHVCLCVFVLSLFAHSYTPFGVFV